MHNKFNQVYKLIMEELYGYPVPGKNTNISIKSDLTNNLVDIPEKSPANIEILLNSLEKTPELHDTVFDLVHELKAETTEFNNTKDSETRGYFLQMNVYEELPNKDKDQFLWVIPIGYLNDMSNYCYARAAEEENEESDLKKYFNDLGNKFYSILKARKTAF